MIQNIKYKDEWLVRALIYYQIIDEKQFSELSQRFAEESYFYDVLVKNNYLEPSDLVEFIESALKIPHVDLKKVRIEQHVAEVIPESFCREHLIMPFKLSSDHIHIARFDPSNLDLENEIEYITGKYVKSYFAFKDDISHKIDEMYDPDKLIDEWVGENKSKSGRVKLSETEEDAKESSVVKLVNQMLLEAIDEEASDVHVEPNENGVSVRYRIDGVLRNKLSLPHSVHPKLISRIKIISNLDIAETRKPQDGKARISVDGAEVDLRVSIMPTSYGEKTVIRILDRRKAMISFEKLGLRGKNKELLKQCFDFKQGIVLVTGPTGSGKSTTLYAALNRIRSTTNNILTIEDPIEYMLDGINQVQVNEKAGVTFATALRSFLRQDPDVILVGEIRDRDTASTAIQAAQTGHLVLSTLHTNDTFNAITRLGDMGIKTFKVVDALQGIVAQRLVRRLCDDCKEEVPQDKIDIKLRNAMKSLGYSPKTYQSRGCEKCHFSGYSGRIGVYEILILDDYLKDLFNKGNTLQEIRINARKQGFRNLFEDAVSLIAEGITDYPEILRVIQPSLQQEAPGESKTRGQTPPEVQQPKQPQKETPQSVPKEETPKKQSDTPPEQENDQKDILVVDDYRLTRMIINKYVNKIDQWKVREAENGKQALEQVKKAPPDVIILDIMMPEMDGYEFLQHLRANEEWQNIPVLILTALNTTENEVKVLDMGADDFITKPIERDILMARLKRIFRQSKRTVHKKVNQSPVPPTHTEASSSDEDDDDMDFNLI